MMDTKMRKKKVLAIVLSVVLALSTFVACNSSDSSDSASDSASDSDNVNVDVASGVGVSSSTHTDIELTTTTTTNTERNTERRTTERVTTESTTEATTHAAQQEKTTEATTEATASAHSTSTSAPAPTTEATTAATTATVATTEARECQHNWITQVTQIDHPAVTHNEARTVRKDTGEDVTGQQLVWHDGIHSIRTGSYTVYTCQCGFQGSPDEVEAHQRQYSGTDERPQHGRVQTHTEYTYAEVEDRTITVVDQEAWTENRVTSYICTICGATREAGN